MTYAQRQDLDKVANAYRTAFMCSSNSVALRECKLNQNPDGSIHSLMGCPWAFGRYIRVFTLRHYNQMTPKSLERIIRRYHRTGNAYGVNQAPLRLAGYPYPHGDAPMERW